MQSTVVFVWMLVLPASAHWWLIGQDLIEQSKRYGGAFQVSCSKYHLTAEQKRQCDDPGNRDFVISMGQGVNIVAQHCNITFKNRQWNCPYVGGSHPFTRIAYQESRESAYLYAITSAMAMYTITRNCAKDKIDNCGCGSKPRDPTDNFEWGRCSEDVNFGYQKSKSFVDAAETTVNGDYPASAKLNLHNNEAGRLMVKDNLVMKCQCHGFSGSCQLRTCWKEMMKWEDVFSQLQTKYDSAIQVKLDKSKLRNSDPKDRQFQPEDLVHLNQSPNLCVHNASAGTLGTHNRKCSPNVGAEDYCIVMCCGRGYREHHSQKETLGKCRLHRFQLKCETITEKVTEYFCK